MEPLGVLLDLTRRLVEEQSLEDALQHVTDAALRLLPVRHASIRVLDESRSDLLSGARSGAGRHAAPLTFRPGEGVAGWVAQHGRAARIDDARADPRFIRRPGQGFRIRSIMAVPLWSAGGVVGVLAATSPAPGVFGPRDENLALLLANCAVPAIERARLERLAVTDHHTMAFNRRYLLPRIRREMADARRNVTPLGLLLMDLDHFKRVNDRHGHPAGDRVLRAFADLVRATTRRRDVLVRRGGEEFVLVMPSAGRRETLAVAQRIRRTTAATPFEVAPGAIVRQTVSIGVATWNRREDAEAFEARADAALYEAKRAGRNRVRVAPPPG